MRSRLISTLHFLNTLRHSLPLKVEKDDARQPRAVAAPAAPAEALARQLGVVARNVRRGVPLDKDAAAAHPIVGRKVFRLSAALAGSTKCPVISQNIFQPLFGDWSNDQD